MEIRKLSSRMRKEVARTNTTTAAANSTSTSTSNSNQQPISSPSSSSSSSSFTSSKISSFPTTPIVVGSNHHGQLSSTLKSLPKYSKHFKMSSTSSFRDGRQDKKKTTVHRGTKSQWEEDALLELLFQNPESLTDEDLELISLSKLAKNLNPKCSSHVTMKTYLRWLEVHRQHPSQLTKFWPNTINQWVNSLKTRSYTKQEILSQMKKWKDANGPFKSSVKWEEPRNQPTDAEISNTFDGLHIGRKDRSSESHITQHREKSPERHVPTYSDRSYDKYTPWDSRACHKDKMMTVPAPNYICNRCGVRGKHLLQECPTNMDPSYDTEPPMTYTCAICKKDGKHWVTLCPKNTNRESITQRRLALDYEASKKSDIRKEARNPLKSREMPRSSGMEGKNQAREALTSKARLGAGKISPDHNKKQDTMMFDYSDTEDADGVPAVIKNLERLPTSIRNATRKRTRPDPTREESPGSPNERASKRRLHCGDNYSDVDESMDEMRDTRFLHSDDKRYDSNLGGIFKETDPYTDEFGLDRMWRSASPGLPTLQVDMDFRTSNIQSVTTSSSETIGTPEDDKEDGFDSPKIRVETPPKIYCDFVRNLIQDRTEVVNRIRRRPTALDHWDEDDNRRLQHMNVSSTPTISPFTSPLSSLESDGTSDVIMVDHPLGRAATEESDDNAVRQDTSPPIANIIENAMEAQRSFANSPYHAESDSFFGGENDGSEDLDRMSSKRTEKQPPNRRLDFERKDSSSASQISALLTPSMRVAHRPADTKAYQDPKSPPKGFQRHTSVPSGTMSGSLDNSTRATNPKNSPVKARNDSEDSSLDDDDDESVEIWT